MAFNEYMHPRNIYKSNPPDFNELGKNYPEFAKHLKEAANGKPFINFRSTQAVTELFIALAHRDFQLSIQIPKDRLSPTLPSRLNYIHFVEDLLNTLPESGDTAILDIGCGSSCIYPLLGVTLNPDWKFTAAEKDDKNYKFAARNVEKNNLCEKIKVLKVDDESTHLIPNDYHKYTACMCNPPFFVSKQEQDKTNFRPSANSSCTGDNGELCYEGGDLGFAGRIFAESLLNPNKCSWFTTMFGKQSSHKKLKKKLHAHTDLTVVSYELCQGNTMRWILAWSFRKDLNSLNLPESEFQKSKQKRSSKKPFVLVICTSNRQQTIDSFLQLLDSIVNIEKLEDKLNSFKLTSYTKGWVGCRKRRRLNQMEVIEKSEKSSLTLVCTVNVSQDDDNKVSFYFSSTETYREEVNRLIVYLKRKLR